MDNILVIGAGGVSHVTVHKMAQNPNYFKNIILASRSIEKCCQIKKSVKDRYNINITVAELDADNVNKTVALIKKFNPFFGYATLPITSIFFSSSWILCR